MFKAKISYAELDYIKKAYRNENTDDVNYGYLSVQNPTDGEIIDGFLWELSYHPVKEEATFKLLRKK
jgi:hypothetical protein